MIFLISIYFFLCSHPIHTISVSAIEGPSPQGIMALKYVALWQTENQFKFAEGIKNRLLAYLNDVVSATKFTYLQHDWKTTNVGLKRMRKPWKSSVFWHSAEILASCLLPPGEKFSVLPVQQCAWFFTTLLQF